MDYASYRGRGRDKLSGAARPLTYLTEAAEWVDQILCIEDENDQYYADEVLGGSNGIVNAPTNALTNRTLFLRNFAYRLADVVSALNLTLAPLLQTIKTLKIGIDNEPSDYTSLAWLQFPDTQTARDWIDGWTTDPPVVRLEYEDGEAFDDPFFELTLDDGRVFYLRTDGQSYIIPDIPEEV